MAKTVAAASPFGVRLRRWRATRGVSQLALAADAATTSRHISFLETGRSRPSREMVSRLGEVLGLPLRERNELFVAAGFAGLYPETPLEADDLAPFRSVITQMLAVHDPYPAYVVDRHWTIVDANQAARRFLETSEERNVVRLTYGGAWRELIDNWAAVAWLGVRRLQDEVARFPEDQTLGELLDVALAAVRGISEPEPAGGERVLCPHFRVGDHVIRTLGVVAHFGSPRDVTLDELRVELIYPADAAAEAFFRTGG